MLFLRRRLIRKFAVLDGILLLIGALGLYLFPNYAWAIVMGSIGIQLAMIFYWISYPLNRILNEVKALLTGKQYNRIYTKKIDEIGVIGNFFNEVTRSLERVSGDIKEHRRISSELNIAQKIQRDLLPKASPDIPGLEIIAKTRPAAEIGGDSFDFITKNDQTFIYIGDVTGHGIPSGLVMMIVYTLIHTFSDLVETSHQLLTQVNKYLKPRIKATMFMTMVMLRWHHPTKSLFYTGAGHETMIHYKHFEKKCDNIKSGGIALGMIPDISNLVSEQRLDWNEGDFMILYSDGIVEGRNIAGEMFGIPHLVELTEKWAPQSVSAEVLFQKLAAEVTLFVKGHIQEDDMTLIVIRNGEAAPNIMGGALSDSTQWENEQKNAVSTENQPQPPPSVEPPILPVV